MRSIISGLLRASVMYGTLLAMMVMPSHAAADESDAPVVAEIGQDGIQRTTLILDSYSFTPNHLIVQAGKPVELTLRNVAGLTPHDLVLSPKAGLTIRQDVKAGDETVLRFTPTVPGQFEFHCSKKLMFFASHKDKGMVGTLEVR
jgi:heme/copper-type cytochrome/quinol oxidase subunit 2